MTLKSDKLIQHMRENPKNVRFSDLLKVCTELFGHPRKAGGSHIVFAMPWPGDPRINLQKSGDKAKAYQVKQVLAAIDKMNEL